MRKQLISWNSVRRFFVLVFALLLVTMVWLFVTHDAQERFALSTGEVLRLVGDTGSVVLDVRTAEEFRSETGHISGAINISSQKLVSRLSELDSARGRHLIVYCRTQNRSRKAAEVLRGNGFDAKFMMGGIIQWNREKKPVVREEP